MKGEQITNPQRIIELAKEKKAIWCDWTTNGYRVPAAVIQNWQFYMVMRAINEGALYEYIPKVKSKGFKNSLNTERRLLENPNKSYSGLTNKELNNLI